MEQSAVHASPVATGRSLDWLKIAALPLAAAGFLTLTDAFELNVLPLGERFAYWLILLGMGQAVSVFLRARLGVPPRSGRRLFLTAAISCVASAVPMSIVVWAVTSLLLSQPLDSRRLAAFYVAVLVVTVAMFALNILVRPRAHAEAVSDGEQPAIPPSTAIRTRLPAKLKTSPIRALEAEDHYVRVHTAAGSDLVLVRFADAISEMGEVDGAQVHRSWWVARDAVESARTVGDRRVLVLAGGIEAPVSRSLTKTLREAGWFS